MHDHRTADLPEHAVTFVFTDVEGSTRLAEELGDAGWAALLDVHHRILREAFAEGGREVRTEGDSFFVVFERAPEALRAAITAQRRLTSYPWPDHGRLRVRMGLHSGEAIARDGDYVGHHVHRANRVCDAAHGGQILLSEATVHLTHGALPEGAALADLGLHRLKDLGAPQSLFSVEAPGLEADFPPVRSLESFANNLPEQRSTFIGREEEIARIRKLLEPDRLVTLTGVGGCGKTRLALQVAAEELDRHPDGVFFVDLAPLSDPALVPTATAEAVGLRSGGGLTAGTSQPVANLLVDALAGRTCLVVLDNCEHLLDACAELADGILASGPGVRILATSREPLDVEGERVHRVPSLSVPDEDGTEQHSEAVDLFVDRARAARSDFELRPEDGNAIAQICRRLDGIPLAIEFAAARVTHLSVGQIAEHLDDRFRLLTGGRRRVRRQQTLEAALDWSHDLLDEAQQALLRRLAVFSGSFGLRVAEEACSGEPVTRAAVLDLLGSLVAKSLVATETVDGEMRYRLLETVRSYAEAKLAGAGEAEGFRSRHRDAYLGWLESIPWEDLLFEVEVVSALAREQTNLRTALEWSRSQGRRDLVGRMAARQIPLYWESHGEQERGWLEWALEDPEGLDHHERAACHMALALADARTTEILAPEMERHAVQAIELGGHELSGPVVHAYGLRAQAVSFRFAATEDPDLASEARALADDAVRTAGKLGDPWPITALAHHGYTMFALGDVAAAERSFTDVLKRASGKPVPIARMASSQLSTCRTLLGDLEGALQAARWGTDTGPSSLRTHPIDFLAAALAQTHLGRTADAAANLETAIHLATSGRQRLPLEANECLIFAAAIAYETGDLPRASRLLAAAVTVGDARDAPVPFRTHSGFVLYRLYLPRVREGLGAEQARDHRDQGLAMSRDEAIADALDVAASLRQ